MVFATYYRFFVVSIVLQVFVLQLHYPNGVVCRLLYRDNKLQLDQKTNLLAMKNPAKETRSENATVLATMTTLSTANKTALKNPIFPKFYLKTITLPPVKIISRSTAGTNIKLRIKTTSDKCDDGAQSFKSDDKECNISMITTTTENMLNQWRRKIKKAEYTAADELESVFVRNNNNGTINNTLDSDSTRATTGMEDNDATTEDLLHEWRLEYLDKFEDFVAGELEEVFVGNKTNTYNDNNTAIYIANSNITNTDVINGVNTNVTRISNGRITIGKNPGTSNNKKQSVSDGVIDVDYYEKTVGRYVSFTWKLFLFLLVLCVIFVWLSTFIADKYRRKKKKETPDVVYPLEDTCGDSSHLYFPSLDTSKTYRIIKEMTDTSHYDTPRSTQPIYEEVIFQNEIRL